MDFTLKIRMGRPRSADPLNEIESIAVSASMKKKLAMLKNQGLPVPELARDFLAEIIRRAESGEIDGIKAG